MAEGNGRGEQFLQTVNQFNAGISNSTEEVHLLKDNDQNTMVCQLIDGHYFPNIPGIRRNIRNAESYKARKEDIWICCYAKSGTHWTWEIVHMLLNGSAEYTTVPKETTQFDFHDSSKFTDLPSPRVMNTALWWHQMPQDVWNQGSKVIHCMRNPKDVAVSYYLHTKELYGCYQYKGSWEGYLDMYMKGEVVRGSWFDYELGWWKNCQDNKNVLFLKYEDMVKDLKQSIQTIAAFLDISLSDTLCQDITTKCTFSIMKTSMALTELEHKIHYRKGIIGDWKNWFTVKQNEDFDRFYHTKLKNSGLNFKFD